VRPRGRPERQAAEEISIDVLVTKNLDSSSPNTGRIGPGVDSLLEKQPLKPAMTMITRTLISAVFALTTCSAALAQGAAKPTLIGTFQNWSAWSYSGTWGSGDKKICFIYSEPEKMQPPRLDHGRISFSVTSSPGAGVQMEANFIAGYPLKEQSSVTVDIDGKKFEMFTQGDSAWLVKKEDEQALLAAMKAGKAMVITAQSRRGNNTTYNYSLSGVTAATEKMQSECQ
jgi:invasion protein IalB